jgi:hypothetical protein
VQGEKQMNARGWWCFFFFLRHAILKTKQVASRRGI